MSNVLIIGLFLYSKLLPHKDKLNTQYKSIFNFFNTFFDPILNFLKRLINPFQIGQGLSIDMTQIILLVALIIISNLN
jgi:hypothetical protein